MKAEFNKYLSAAKNFGEARTKRDFSAGNRYADELVKLGKIVRSEADGQEYLLGLLSNEDPYVQCWSAKDCLFFAPDRGAPVLEKLAHSDGMLSLSATVTLDEWRAGRLK